ncbi:MAG: spore coat protein U domain-containing protein [Deltaproteobacteria bacterium]|nr:spore coat protein U domain-containing protein [Deltaproteobacteria bacterium]
MKKLLLWIMAGVAVLTITAGVAKAASVMGPFSTTATVIDRCRVVGVNDMAFGSYDPTAANPADAAGSFAFRCPKGANYNLYISGARVMTSASTGDNLGFDLYTDTARSSEWPGASVGVTGTSSSNSPVLMNVYGRVPAGQNAVSAPDYAKTVIVTVEW